MTVQEQLINEIKKTPKSLLPEVLDFLMFVNHKYIQQSSKKGKGWQPNFFEDVIGGWEGEKLVREIQPDYQTREELR
jgi:hypothetical protein